MSKSLQESRPVCVKTLRVAANRFDCNQHEPTQPLPKNPSLNAPKQNDAGEVPLRPAKRYLNNCRFSATPGPLAIALTKTMPHTPVNINTALALRRRVDLFIRSCAVRATVRLRAVANGSWLPDQLCAGTPIGATSSSNSPSKMQKYGASPGPQRLHIERAVASLEAGILLASGKCLSTLYLRNRVRPNGSL
jgi:hypothetical protein